MSTDKNSPDPISRYNYWNEKTPKMKLRSKSTEAKRVLCEACGDSFHPGNIGYHRQYEAQGNLDKHRDTDSTAPTADALFTKTKPPTEFDDIFETLIAETVGYIKAGHGFDSAIYTACDHAKATLVERTEHIKEEK